MNEPKTVVEAKELYCSRAKKLIDLGRARAECAKEHKCVGSCVMNVEFYIKATARYLGGCK